MKAYILLIFIALSAQTLFSSPLNNTSGTSTKIFEQGNNKLIVYTDVPGLAPSEFYTIQVRSAATNNEWVACYANITRSLWSALPANAKGTNNTREHYYTYVKDWSHTYANIEMSSGSLVEVQISSKNGFKIKGKDFIYANAHPAQKASKPTVVDNIVYFTIDNPGQITIDINGQMDSTNTGNGYSGPPIHTVSLFANPGMTKPSLNDPNVLVVEPGVKPSSDLGNKTTLYFRPGVHDIGRDFKIYPNKNYYIPGDAIVYGTLSNIGINSGANIRIYGYGTLSGDRIKHSKYDPEFTGNDKSWKLIYAENCSNFWVEGLSLMNCPQHTANLNSIKTTKKNQKETFCHWLKVISRRSNGDGIGTAHDIQDCFIRTQDDCTYVKGDRKRCIFWTDVNGAAFILAGMPSATERDILIEDCDIIYPRHCSTSWAGGRVFSKREEQAPKVPGITQVNLKFKDIRITDKFQTLETFQLMSSGKDVKSGSYSGITFQNITSVKQPLPTDNKIVGWSGGPWSNITFDNVTLGTKKISSVSDFGQIGPYVTNLIFRNATSLSDIKGTK